MKRRNRRRTVHRCPDLHGGKGCLTVLVVTILGIGALMLAWYGIYQASVLWADKLLDPLTPQTDIIGDIEYGDDVRPAQRESGSRTPP